VKNETPTFSSTRCTCFLTVLRLVPSAALL
jgi:hypothetical protein